MNTDNILPSGTIFKSMYGYYFIILENKKEYQTILNISLNFIFKTNSFRTSEGFKLNKLKFII